MGFRYLAVLVLSSLLSFGCKTGSGGESAVLSGGSSSGSCQAKVKYKALEVFGDPQQDHASVDYLRKIKTVNLQDRLDGTDPKVWDVYLTTVRSDSDDAAILVNVRTDGSNPCNIVNAIHLRGASRSVSQVANCDKNAGKVALELAGDPSGGDLQVAYNTRLGTFYLEDMLDGEETRYYQVNYVVVRGDSVEEAYLINAGKESQNTPKCRPSNNLMIGRI